MLKVFGRRNSLNVQKVMWFLAELAREHEHTPVGGAFGGLETPEFLAMNPHGRVPVIDDAGLVVWESHAILRYLAAQYGGPRFWPPDAATRAGIDAWMDWTQTRLQPDFIDGVFWGMYRTPEHLQNWPAIHESIARCGRNLEVLDAVLAGRRYLAGNDLTLADITIGAQLYRYFTLDIERSRRGPRTAST
jgi:glutathione S-transferase